MMNDGNTKKRILEAAEELMLERSFHSVGLKQILEEVNVPKGSFYHYFESKEQFGVEMLEHYMAEASHWKRSLLLPDGERNNPLQRLFAYLDETVRLIESHPDRFPCLALKLSSEVSVLSDAMRRRIAEGVQDWINIYREVLDEAVEQEQLPVSFDTLSEASIIHDLWSGAAHRSIVNRSANPVYNAVNYLKSRISSISQ